MSIRPVSSKLPASESVWEGLNIPMCVVVTPFDSNRLTKQAAAAAAAASEDEDDDHDEAVEFAIPIAAVPKCLECGAPHPTARTHYRPSSRATHLLCYFCGATSSVILDDQQAVRVDEWLDPATYDTTPCIAPHRVVDASSEEEEDGVDVTVDDHNTQDDDESSLQTDNFEFRLPVEDYMVPKLAEDSDENSDSSSSSSSDSDDGGEKRKKKKKKKTRKKKKKDKKKEKRKKKNKVATKKKGWLFGRGNDTDDDDEDADASPKYKVQHIWQFPAVECPPVWWIIVDGSVGGGRVRGRQGTSINSSQSSMGAVRNYWSTIGTTLLRTLADIPPHVHVGLLTASGTRLASWDLTSEVPSVKQYPYSYDPTVTAAATEEEEDPADPGGGARTSCWDLSLVPANRLYKANLEATIRAMVDGGTSRVFAEETLESKHNDIIDLDEDAADQDEETADSSTGIPLGLTIEIILDFMEQAHHPGQDDIDTTDDDDDDDDTAGKKEQRMDRLRYAGGKILCLLGNPPLETAPPSNDSLSCVNQKHFYQGGLAGSCFDATEFELSQNEEATNGSKKKKKNGKKDGKEKKKKKDPELESDDEDARDLTDLTASNLQDFTMALDPDGLFSKIGRRCALAALGVDLFVLVPQENDNEEQEQHIPWYGLPLLRPLSDCSGAPGPLMFGTANANNAFAKINKDDDSDNDNEKREVEEDGNWLLLFENIVARTPWQDRMAFGVQMRLRLPIGFRLDLEPLELDPSMPELQLAPFLTSGGLTGPASSVIDHDSDDGFLWCMGTCDPHTSFTFDLEVDPDTVNEADGVPDSCEMEDVGDVTIKPVIQTCTLFTCIETDGAEPVPNYFTVCKMRVTNTSLSLANDVESIVDGLDPEVLSAVLYQKIVLDSYLDGFLNAQRTAESWLQAFMIGLYHSAQQKQAELEADTESDNDTDDGDSNDDDEEKDKEKSKSGLLSFFSRKKLPASDDDDDESKKKHDEEIAAVAGEEKDDEDKDTEKHNEVNDDDNSDDEEEDTVTKFVVGNRLLDEEGGNLDDEEILMGGGHFKAGILPFLVYSIMQSDGLRPSRDGVYQPSMDARLCAIAQMGSMTPKAMAKSVAPFLSLWSIKDDGPIIETLPLSLAGITNTIEELGDLHDDKDGVLLLESPLQVSLFPLSSLNKIIAKGGDSTDAEEEEHQESIEVGPELESTILSGLNGFRTSPWNTYVDDGSMTVILEDIKDLVSFLLEDKPTALGDDDFNDWKSRIANLVREEVDIDDEDEEATPRGLRRFLPFGKK